MIDEILTKLNLKYEDLTVQERETLNGWMDLLQKGSVSVEKIKEYIKAMKESVENELTSVGHNNKQDIFLKARLRNYIMLDSFLSTPEKAKASLERALAGIVAKK